MHVEYEKMRIPADRTSYIWRYMDFAKFVAMLTNEALFFSRLDKLSNDPYEGSLPFQDYLKREEGIVNWYDGLVEKFNGLPREARTDELFQEMMKEAAQSAENWRIAEEARRGWIAVNCWHESAYESAAMWELYCRNGKGIAVRSTVQRLIESFDGTEQPVYVSKVDYIDYMEDTLGEHGDLERATKKRKSFEHEKELRALIWQQGIVGFDNDRGGRVEVLSTIGAYGKNVDVDLGALVERVYIAPNAQSWFEHLVRDVLARFGMDDVEVVRSKMNEGAVF
jgi:hypothetical protein